MGGRNLMGSTARLRSKLVKCTIAVSGMIGGNRLGGGAALRTSTACSTIASGGNHAHVAKTAEAIRKSSWHMFMT